jgi:uncharacterized membrane protein YkgB
MAPRKTNNVPALAISLLRISVGIIYLWFGALKFFHGYSPAEDLAKQTIHKLTFGLMSDALEINLLATWECAIGVLFIADKWMKPALIFFFLHMICTFTPLIFFPDETFRYLPYGLSLVGQYIIKNLVIISAGVVLWQAEKVKIKQTIRSDKNSYSEAEAFTA